MTDRGTGALDKLPTSVRTRLDELKAALEKALGDDLAAMVVFGSAVRGGWREGRSDVDVALVLRTASRAKLDAIGNALQLARFAARIECVILTTDEIPRAADVFPLLYDDLRECHAVLSGTDPFSSLTISDQHRRLRIEQELREAQIRLRRMVTDALGSQDAVGMAVLRKVRQVRSPLHAWLQMKGTQTDGSVDAVLKASCARFKVAPEALLRAKEQPGEALDALNDLLTAAIDEVDRSDGA